MNEPIAIIGLACRFPGANDSAALWKLLREERDAVSEIPDGRWDVERYYAPPPAVPGKMSTRWGGFIDDADRFDTAFFGIPKREASFMDPQQRVVLEVVWEALENAGIAPDRLAGSNTGVWVGISNYDYNRIMCRDPATMDAYSSTGTILAITANRVSYLLNLYGPSMIVDTACSSSLVSVHLACQSLRGGECDIAIAGGVNLILSPEVSVILSQGGLMSPDGRCKAFSAAANGYVRSEGCGMLVLKRAADAQRDGDTVLATIRGTAVNQDGATNGLTAPSGRAQQAVIRRALADANVAPAELSYLEAHGTGTPLGDIIEWRALKAVLSQDRPRDRACAIGSIKTNIGHCESAAGIAGLIKVILALQNRTIPATLHLAQLNPHIRLDDTPLDIPAEARAWESDNGLRLAGVSSFGIGGTNAHVIVEEAPRREPAASTGEMHLLPISARSEEALHALVRKYALFLAEHGDVALADACFTASCGRQHFAHRAVFRAGSIEEMRAALDGARSHDLGEHGEAYLRGADIDWRALYANGAHRTIALPTYAFARTRFWFDDVQEPPRPVQRLRSKTASDVSP